jgi:hypothetical protein
MKRLMVALLLPTLLAACGGGAGKSGTSSDKDAGLAPVERQYGKSADKVFDATLSAIKSFDLKVDVDRHDDLGGEIVARRADGRRITANVASVDKDTSKVAVRADKTTPDVASQIHERIAEKLGLGEAKPAVFGGNTAEGTYGIGFGGALAAAERACKVLGFVVTNREAHDDWAQLDARTADSTPVRFRMDGKGGGSTAVKFIAGKGTTNDSKSHVSRMKSEFERQIAPTAK